MPRRKKAIRLWLRPKRRDRNGHVRHASWIILDGNKHIATGCAAGEIAAAQTKLADYVAAKYQPTRKARDIEQIDIADVLAIYYEDCREQQADPAKFNGRLERLNEFWGGKKLADVTGQSCREYIALRGNNGGARRDLEDLQAAINHHAKEGLHRGIVRVLLPARGAPRTRWLTRSEVARLLRVCWRTRERQTCHRGAKKGVKLPTDKRPLRHLARFILIGLYSGTRAAAIAAASPHRSAGRSYVDLDNGIFYRLPEGQAATNKRQPPVPLPDRLLAHMRRWVDNGLVKDHFVEWHGSGVRSVKTAFKTAVKLAKLPGKVTPHTLRHTAATWLMQAGVDKWEAAGFLGMSVEMLDRVYGHHHPDYLRKAARGLGYGRRRQSLAETLAGRRTRRAPSSQRAEIISGACSSIRTCLYLQFPSIRENNREFRKSDGSAAACWRQMSQHSQGVRPKFPVKIEPGIPGDEPGYSGKPTRNRRGKPASGAASGCARYARGVSADLGDWIQNPP